MPFRYKVWFARFKEDSNLPKIKTPNIVHLVNLAYGRQTCFIQFMMASYKSEIWLSVNQTNKTDEMQLTVIHKKSWDYQAMLIISAIFTLCSEKTILHW